MLGVAAALTSCGGEQDDESRQGFWFDERAPVAPSDLGELGYAEGYEAATASWTGLRVHDPERAYLGPLIFSSGHEPAAHVLQHDGTIERRWALEDASNADELGPGTVHPSQRAWRRVEPLPDGELLVIHEGVCLLKLNAGSEIVWRGAPGAHHDLLVDGEAVWVLDREVEVLADVTGAEASDDDPLVVRDGLALVSLADGTYENRINLADALAASEWSEILEQARIQARSIDIGVTDARGRPRTVLDPLHANALLVLPEAPEQLVVFLRDVGAFLGVAVETGDATWFRLGPWQGAHDPQIDPQIDPQVNPGAEGRILLFDNFGRADPAAPASRIVAIDRTSFETTTVFEDTPPTRFHSPVCGAIHPLPGGLWLVVETTAGRAFQIDASGEIVWEFRTPFRIEREGLVAALLDMRPLLGPR